MDELSRTNNDISNLLGSTEIGTIFLDTGLNIKRFTPATTNIFNLIQTDLDRPISDITSKIKYEHLEKYAQEVLCKLIMREAEVQDINGNWYTMRIAPYRTTENVIDGIVITFVDITRVKQSEIALRRLTTVVMDSNDAITVQDFSGNITAWNKVAQKMYGYSEKEAMKMNISNIIPQDKRKEASVIIKKLQKDDGEKVETFETRRITKDGKTLDVLLTITMLAGDDEKPIAIAYHGTRYYRAGNKQKR